MENPLIFIAYIHVQMFLFVVGFQDILSGIDSICMETIQRGPLLR